MKPFILNTPDGDITLDETMLEILHDYYEQQSVKDTLIDKYYVPEDKASTLALRIIMNSRKLHVDKEQGITLDKQEIYKVKLQDKLNNYVDYRFMEEDGYLHDPDSSRIRIVDTLTGGMYDDTFAIELYVDLTDANNIKLNINVDEEDIGMIDVGDAETFYNHLKSYGINEKELIENSYNYYLQNSPFTSIVNSLDIENYKGEIFYFDNNIYLSHTEEGIIVVDQAIQFNRDEASKIMNILYEEADCNYDKVDIFSLPENEGIADLKSLEIEIRSICKHLKIDIEVTEDNLVECMKAIDESRTIEEDEMTLNRIFDCGITLDRYTAIEEFYNLDIDQDVLPIEEKIHKNYTNENMEI